MNEVLKGHQYTRPFSAIIIFLSGPLSLLKNNDKSYYFYVKEEKEEVKDQSLQIQRGPKDLLDAWYP